MIGGVSWPLVDDATSTAPAFSAGKPTRFISGMVNVPVVTTLAIEDPEIRPVMPDETTAALAGPPRMWPRSENATRMKYPPAPALSSSAPNSTNRNTKPVDTPSAMPNTPSVDSHWCDIVLASDAPLWAITSGIQGPKNV